MPAAKARPRASGQSGLAWGARCLSALVLLALPWLASCSSTPAPWSFRGAGPDPYQRLSPDEVEELRMAVEALEAGDLMSSRSTIASLANRRPGDVHAAIWHQEARIAWIERRSSLIRAGGDSTDSAEETLRKRYRLEAEQTPSPLAYLLAARLESDELAAQLLLKKALELDPRMSWAHYALAHVAARVGDWSTARRELDLTFERQSNHLPALRLYGWLQAGAGDTERAIRAMEAWLDQASKDLLATRATRDQMRLDLALAYYADGDTQEALSLLSELAPGDVDEVRRLTAMAVVEESRGDLTAARRAIDAARVSDESALLPAVQEALLLELWLQDFEGAKVAWTRVIDLAAGSQEVAAGMQSFRAQVHLQRLEREHPALVEERP